MHKEEQLNLTIPRFMPTSAKRALLKLIDEYVSTDRFGASLTIPDEKALRFNAEIYIKSLESQPEPKNQLRYLEALLEAGTKGAKLSALRLRTGSKTGKRLGGIASSVARSWRKIAPGMPDLVVRTKDWHYLNQTLLPAFNAGFGK